VTGAVGVTGAEGVQGTALGQESRHRNPVEPSTRASKRAGPFARGPNPTNPLTSRL